MDIKLDSELLHNLSGIHAASVVSRFGSAIVFGKGHADTVDLCELKRQCIRFLDHPLIQALDENG